MNRKKENRADIPREIEHVTEQLLSDEQKSVKSERISEALQIFNDALNSSMSAVILTDLDGVIIYSNMAFLRLFKIDGDQRVVGRRIEEIFSQEKSGGIFAGTFSVHEKGIAEEAELRRDDGSSFTAGITLSPINNSHGEIIGRMMSFRDITARMQAEREKERLNRELEQKNRELEQIVYVASHDLRSPLVNVQGFSRELEHSIGDLHRLLNGVDMPESVKNDMAMILNDDIAESLRFILSSVSKMDKLLAGLLRLSRLGRAALHMEKLDMNKLVSDITNAMEFQIKEAGATVIKEELPACLGDETQIGQVFTNLVDNAIKYRQAHRPLQIKISGRCLENECEYRVEDNGKGIDPGHQEKIFEIFHRLNPASGSGEGLGLTIVRRVLDKHRGRVSVRSALENGSTFFVYLPNRFEEKGHAL